MVYELNELKELKETFHNQEEQQHSLQVPDDIEINRNLRSHLLENRNWSWSYMKRQLKYRNLELLYSRYRQILHQGYFSVFLLLQILLTIIHVGFLLIKEVDDPQHNSLPDIISYISISLLLWPLVSLIFDKNLVEKYFFLPHIVSCLAIAIVVVVDLALPIYHTSIFNGLIPLRPAFAAHTLLACYIFLPLSNNITPIILGFGITLCHILTLTMVTYRNSSTAKRYILSETIFFICVNGMGFYYRLIKEMVIRRAFLDRRACIEFTMKLNYEKEQEEQLLLSILPWHIAARVREDIRKKSFQSNPTDELTTFKPFKELYIEKHDNVSILYADIVNYTEMTSTLPVNKLVETLNELFGKFDEASERHKVLRIKFLGDCYYCAAGIPQPNPDHAKCCVDLALNMIAIIQEVRQEKKLDIDMRIGIHSGSILSGLIGRCKWQYDIWSKDVVIANHTEQSGKPGMVHVTKQTLDLLSGNYIIEPGNGHLRDQILAKYNIKTFLIKPQEEERYSYVAGALKPQEIIREKSRLSKLSKKSSLLPRKSKFQNLHSKNGPDVIYGLRGVISGEGAMALSRRRTAFMNNNLIMYQQRLKMADVYMEKAIDSLPSGQSNLWFQYKMLHPFSLTFQEEFRWELPFLQQPDPLFKFYMISVIFISIGICAIQFCQPPKMYLISCVGFGFSIIGLICFIPLTWCHYIWNAFNDPKYQMEKIPEPKNRLLFFLYKCSMKIIWSCCLRTLIYFVICILLTFCSIGDFLVRIHAENTFNGQVNDEETYNLWLTTECCYLTLITSFFFTRIHFQLKLFVGILIVILYSCLIFTTNVKYSNETWNPNLEPKIAHVLSLTFLVLGLHLMDRQAECMDRLDYLWKRQLGNEKNEAEKTRSINLILLHNILPIHVAKVYLNTSRVSNDLYHENYDCVSVMFASLINFDLYHGKDVNNSELKSLEILNKIICEFDDALFENKFKTVEKIKVAGSTYLAACGLHPGQKDSNNLIKKEPMSTKMVVILAEFATTVLRRLEKINKDFKTEFKLRIGMSHGPVTAGVVGSQKPLYDIWGNAVNIASRMDSTGEPGKIQVTSTTAYVLQNEGICCTYRGPTFVKGKGIIDTYFIDLTNTLYLKKK